MTHIHVIMFDRTCLTFFNNFFNNLMVDGWNNYFHKDEKPTLTKFIAFKN